MFKNVSFSLLKQIFLLLFLKIMRFNDVHKQNKYKKEGKMNEKQKIFESIYIIHMTCIETV